MIKWVRTWQDPNSSIEMCTRKMNKIARSTLEWWFKTNTLRMKLLSINYQATRLLGVLNSHITIHLSAFRLRQHGTEGWIMMARSITTSRIHKSRCNPHENPDIKTVILQGRTESKAGLAFWSAEHNCFDPILDMEEVLEFVSPSHSAIEWLDGPQE